MMDPATIMFAAVAAKKGCCACCLFENERSTVCHAAGAEAKRRGVEDCEAGYIYVLVERDARQLDLIGGEDEA
jgi:hypothetical protein